MGKDPDMSVLTIRDSNPMTWGWGFWMRFFEPSIGSEIRMGLDLFP